MSEAIQKVFIGLSIILTFAVSGLAAERLSVNIPFDFQVGDTLLVSGEYDVVLINGNVLMITSADGRRNAYGLSLPNDRNNSRQSVLVFNRHGVVHFLSQVTWSGGGPNRKLLPQTEIEMAGNSQGVRVVRLINRK